MAELAKKFDLHPNLITQWKTQIINNASVTFGDLGKAEDPVDVDQLHAKIGQLELENDFLEKALGHMGDPSAKRR